MQHLMIISALFLIIIIIDLIPLLKEKEWGYLFFAVPVYVISLALNLLPAFDVHYTSISALIMRMLSKFVK